MKRTHHEWIFCMNGVKRIWKTIVFLGIVFTGVVPGVHGQERDSLTDEPLRKFVHGVKIEGRPEYIFPTHSFLRGENPKNMVMREAYSFHAKYFFRYRPGSAADRTFGGVYQGIGIGFYTFRDPELLGDPVAFYLFQGARIARLAPRLSFNYEWNLGLSAGWKPYDVYENPTNTIMGSKVNAYLNADFYLRWDVSPWIGLTAGLTFSHFSNGNTNIPNAGLNTIGGNFGLVCNFNPEKKSERLERMTKFRDPVFRSYVSCDFVVFGSWRIQMIKTSDGYSPSPESYAVFGFNFAPMYNLNRRLRLGVSLDGTFDAAANLYTEDYVYGLVDKSQILRPDLSDQFALGLSGRVEYVMPFFTVGIGMGANFIGKGDLNMFYQMFTLKIALSNTVFLHVGYNLKEFHDPNFLMLGVGFRFNNKSIVF